MPLLLALASLGNETTPSRARWQHRVLIGRRCGGRDRAGREWCLPAPTDPPRPRRCRKTTARRAALECCGSEQGVSAPWDPRAGGKSRRAERVEKHRRRDGGAQRALRTHRVPVDLPILPGPPPGSAATWLGPHWQGESARRKHAVREKLFVAQSKRTIPVAARRLLLSRCVSTTYWRQHGTW